MEVNCSELQPELHIVAISSVEAQPRQQPRQQNQVSERRRAHVSKEQLQPGARRQRKGAARTMVSYYKGSFHFRRTLAWALAVCTLVEKGATLKRLAAALQKQRRRHGTVAVKEGVLQTKN